MLTLKIEIDEKMLVELVLKHLGEKLNLPLEKHDITIEVKSKQNYRSEWETAAFRAIVNKSYTK